MIKRFLQKFINESTVESEEFVKQFKQNQENYDNEVIDAIVYNEKTHNLHETFNKNLHNYWKDLMKLEFELHEQIDHSNTHFTRNLIDTITIFIEKVQELFLQFRDLETNYKQFVFNYATDYLKSNVINEQVYSRKFFDVKIYFSRVHNIH